jgi:hypothetical protein
MMATSNIKKKIINHPNKRIVNRNYTPTITSNYANYYYHKQKGTKGN